MVLRVSFVAAARPFCLMLLSLSAAGCYLPRRSPAETGEAALTMGQPLSPESTKGLLKDAAGNWFFGHGVGNTVVQVGAMAAFPPYALVVLGNAALSVSGYETVGVSTVLPPERREGWRSFYDEVTSGPGRLTAAMTGKEFITRERAKERLEQHYKPVQPRIEPDSRG